MPRKKFLTILTILFVAVSPLKSVLAETWHTEDFDEGPGDWQGADVADSFAHGQGGSSLALPSSPGVVSLTLGETRQGVQYVTFYITIEKEGDYNLNLYIQQDNTQGPVFNVTKGGNIQICDGDKAGGCTDLVLEQHLEEGIWHRIGEVHDYDEGTWAFYWNDMENPVAEGLGFRHDAKGFDFLKFQIWADLPGSVYIDDFEMGTGATIPTAVDSRGKLAETWASIKVE